MLSKKTLEYSLEGVNHRCQYYINNERYLSAFGRQRYKELKDAIRELEAELKEIEAKDADKTNN